MPLVEQLRGVRAIHWIALSIFVLALEYYTGPYLQFALLQVFPVVVATARHGRPVGVALAVLLPLIRLSFFFGWPMQSSWPIAVADALVDVFILTGTVVLIDRFIRQEQQLRVLQGLLPICSFCKKIRDEAGEWRQLESYIGARSSARFSHTFCPDCGRRHYPGLAD